jgi:hypothetical protein
MNLADMIVIAVIVLIIGAASAYIIKAKKSGKKCIGCPNSCSCSNAGAKTKKGEGSCCCGCGGGESDVK